jgi:hypothetical protein
MNRPRKKSDANQPELVKQIRMLPQTTVFVTSTVGGGFPDIIVGHRGKNYLMEIKRSDGYPSDRKLTDDELSFFESWKGQVDVVSTIEEVVQVLNRGVRL